MSASISLCMIVRDEEETLERCLLSVHHLVDEIIIVDTGSVDNTVKIAEKYTSNIFFLEWKDNFSFARNFSFSNATKDYILWLDADDYLTKRDQTEFKQLKGQLDDSIDSVTMNYHLSLTKTISQHIA
ncbi:glycosyltransferase family 2 protein [Priestia flexa]